MNDLEYYINQFTWGISSDGYLTPDGACFDMENVDINENSMSITASHSIDALINTRQYGNVIAISPTWEEWVTEDGVIESRDARGGNINGTTPCLFAYPMLWPKLLSSGGSQIVWHTRHNELKTAIRGNAWSYPFWLLLNNKSFSLVNPDALGQTTDKIDWPENVTPTTGWTYEDWVLKHSSWTTALTVSVSADYWTNPDYTTTNYQMFWIGVRNHTQWGFRIKVTADLKVFKWNENNGVYDADSTDSSVTKTWDLVTSSNQEWEWFSYAINWLDGSATWEIRPSDDFDWEIFRVWAVNQENFLSADGDNNPDHLLSLDNSTIKDLGRAGMWVDTTDLQDRAVITEWKGNYVVWAWNYAVILNTNIVKDGYQVKPFLDIILSTSYEIMGITTFGDQITFYANSNGSWYQIVWDWASLYANYIYTWAGQTFETIISSLWYDYVTVRSARNEMQYYVVNWPQRNQIWNSTFFSSGLTWVYKRLDKEQARMLTQRADKEIWGALWVMWCWQPVFAWIWGDLLVFWSKKAWISNAWYKPLSIWFEWGESWNDGLRYATIQCLWAGSWGGIAMHYTNGNWENRIRQIYVWSWENEERQSDRTKWSRWFSYTLNPIIWSHFTEKEIDKFFVSYKLPNQYWRINLYARIDDNMFWRFKPTSTPTIAKGDLYYVANAKNTLEYIETDGEWLIFRRNGQLSIPFESSNELTKVSGDGDNTITFKEVDNRVKVGMLSYNGFDHNYENLMNTQVSSKLPFFHKIQFKIEWECIDEEETLRTENTPPEIYNIYIPFKQHTVW